MKAVIFDFNGTLFFDNDKHIQAWGEISKILRGKPIEDEELHVHVNGVPNIKVIQYFLNNQATNEQLEKYSKLKEEIYRKCCKEHKESFHLVKGSYEYFDLLKEKNIPFTIASASIIENINFFYIQIYFIHSTLICISFISNIILICYILSYIIFNKTNI